MYSIIGPVRIGRDQLLLVIFRRDENLLCLVYILFTAAGEVKTPSKRCAKSTILSTFRAVHCRENRKKQQSKMSNLFLSRLYCSIFLTLVQHRLRWQMSESRRCPVIAPDAVSPQSYQCYRERDQSYNRSISHTQIRRKIMGEAKLRHASTLFLSRNALTATIYLGWD